MPELNTVVNITELPPALCKMAETLTGFDREDMDTGGELNGILEYCHSAADEEVHVIGADEAGTYSLKATTTFADGSALTDRTLCQYHTPTETKFSYWRHGVLVEVTTAKKITLADDFEGYIGYDADGDLDDTITDVRDLIVRTPLVAFLYLNDLTGKVTWYADERHGNVISGQAHLLVHQDGGFFIAQGLDIPDVSNNDTDFTTVGAGNCGDEDIVMRISEMTECPFMYRSGTGGKWIISDTSDSKFGYYVSGAVRYNLNTGGVWSLESISNDRVATFFVATNNKLHPVVKIIGQILHTDRGTARDRIESDWWHMDTEGLPGQELQPIGSMLINNSSTGTIEKGNGDESWYDMRHGGSIPRFA